MKRVLKTVAVAFIIALILILIKNEYARCLPASTYGMQAAIGSSMFRQGLDIDVLEAELPGSSYILSYNGNQPALMALELQYMLEQGLQVKNLYIDLYPYTAAADPWISDTKILLDTDLKFKAKAWRLMRNSTDVSFGDFYEFFVTANNEQLLTYPLNNKIVSSQFRDGGSLIRQQGRTREELYALGTLGSRDGVNCTQAEGYGKIVELAEDYGLNLWFLETPKYERMYADEDYQEALSIVQELQSGWPGDGSFAILCGEELDFDISEAGGYQDLIHLSAEGRESYTALLCEKLKATE